MKARSTNSLEIFQKFLRRLLEDEKEDLFILTVYGICISICSLVIPIAVQTFVNTIGFGLLLQPILVLTLIVFSILIFSGGMQALQVYVAELLQQRLFVKIAMELSIRIPKMEYTSLRNAIPTPIHYFFEISTLQKTIVMLVLDATATFLQVLFGMLLLAFYHPFLLVLDWFIVLFIFLFFFRLARKATETSIDESKSKYAIAYWLQELAKNLESFRTWTSRSYAHSRADELTSHYILNKKSHFKILFKQILAAEILQIFVNSVLLGVGGWLVVRGQLTLGQLVASELIVNSVLVGIGKFGKHLENYYDLAASMDKIGYLFEIPLEPHGGEYPKKARNQQPILRIKNLQLNHESKPLNFEIQSKSKTAIFGPIGSGKSQLIQSLYRLIEPHSGTIEVDHLEVRYSCIEGLRSKIAYVCDTSLFQGSLLENIRFFDETKSILFIKKILQDLCFGEFLEALPLGLHTPLCEAQKFLTKTQIKKILIARAIVSEPDVILFDNILEDSFLEPVLEMFLKQKQDFAIVFTTTKREFLNQCNSIIDLTPL